MTNPIASMNPVISKYHRKQLADVQYIGTFCTVITLSCCEGSLVLLLSMVKIMYKIAFGTMNRPFTIRFPCKYGVGRYLLFQRIHKLS